MGAPSVVNLDIDASINDLQLGSFDTLNFQAGTQLAVFGTQIINAGQINMNSGGGANAALELANNVTLSGEWHVDIGQYRRRRHRHSSTRPPPT